QNDKFGLNGLTSGERDFVAVNVPYGFAEMKDNSVRLVEAANKRADFCSEDFLHRHFVRRDDMDGDTSCTERGSDFEANEAGADYDYLPGGCRFRDDGLAVRERAQVESLRRRSPFERQAYRS